MSANVKVALLSGVVSIIVALISAFSALYPHIKDAREAAEAADSAASSASSSAAKARETLDDVAAVAAAVPGATATHYRGRKNQSDGTTERFNFSERILDPQNAVVTGSDWRLGIPADGIYYIGASFTLPYGPEGRSHTAPYVSCALLRLEAGTATPQRLNGTHMFNPSCAISGAFALTRGDRVFATLGKSGAYGDDANGEFFSVLVGPKRGAR